MVPDLQKLRRFALTVALVHLAFVSAGVQLNPGGNLSPLGIPLKISTPHLFHFVLLGASLYALLRFLFYGYLLGESPASARRAVRKFIVKAARSKDGYYHPLVDSPNEAEAWIRRVEKSVPGGHCTYQSVAGQALLDAWIPSRARHLGWLQDLDYSAPVWTNVLAMIAGSVRMFADTIRIAAP